MPEKVILSPHAHICFAPFEELLSYCDAVGK